MTPIISNIYNFKCKSLINPLVFKAFLIYLFISQYDFSRMEVKLIKIAMIVTKNRYIAQNRTQHHSSLQD